MNAKIDDVLYKQAQKNIQRIGLDFDKELGKSIKKGGNIVAAEARRNAPSDTGAGKKTIRARKSKKSQSHSVSIAPDQDHMYMLFPEFGTESQEKQWFVHGALESKEGAVIAAIESDLRAVIK